MRFLSVALLVVSGSIAAGCGDKANPARPSPSPAPAVSNLTISGADAVLTGVSSIYTATAGLSDGTTQAVTPTWTSSNPDVATVNSSGRLDGRAHGSITLTASHEGRSTSTTVHVISNYGGSWTGRYVIRACEDSGIYTDGVFGGVYEDVPYCQVPFNRVGVEQSVTLTLSQTGHNLSEISGSFFPENAGYVGGLKGVVTPDGRLTLAGTFSLLNWDLDAVVGTLQVAGWDTNLGPAGAMTGRWTETETVIARPGKAYQERELLTMTRTTPSAGPAPASN
jgi:hypothetical protein